MTDRDGDGRTVTESLGSYENSIDYLKEEWQNNTEKKSLEPSGHEESILIGERFLLSAT